MLAHFYGQPFSYFTDQLTTAQLNMAIEYMNEALTGDPAGPEKDMPDLDGFHEHVGKGRVITR